MGTTLSTTVDAVMASRQRQIVVGSFLTFHSMYWACRVLYPKISQTYNNLEKDKKGYWCASSVSTIHAIIITYLTFEALIKDRQIIQSNDFFYKSQKFTDVESMFVGYLWSDLLLALYYGKRWNGFVANILHHVCVLTVWSQFALNDFGHFFSSIAHLCEITTPFVNQRWFFHESNMASSSVYFYNGLLMTFLWFVTRIIGYSYVGFYIFVGKQKDQLLTLKPIQYSSIWFCYIAGFFLQYFWFYKILRGALKSIRKKKEEKKGEKQK